jgi:hypothetical protein
MGGPLSWSARVPKASEGYNTTELYDVHAIKLPQLKHSESAPVFSAHRRKYDPRLGTSLSDTPVDEKEDDMEVVELGPLSISVAQGYSENRPVTAWAGAARPRSRGGSESEAGLQARPATSQQARPRSRGQTSWGSKPNGWQLSLCHSVAIHCPSALPTKETFAQKKVPRPVSPLRQTSSRPESSEFDDSAPRHDPSLHASIGERLLNMRRSSRSTSSLESCADAEPAADVT